MAAYGASLGVEGVPLFAAMGSSDFLAVDALYACLQDKTAHGYLITARDSQPSRHLHGSESGGGLIHQD